MPFTLFEDQQEFVTGLRRSPAKSNRAIAKETGAKFYMPANPCKRCDGWLRRADSGSCHYCATARRKRVYWEGKKSRPNTLTFRNYCEACEAETDHYSASGNCKPCERPSAKARYSRNREEAKSKMRQSYFRHRSKRLRANKERYQENREALLPVFAEYRENNQERIRAYRKLPESMAAHRERQRALLATPEGKASSHMRNSIHRLLRDKNGSASCELVGYSARDLVAHIESQFLAGMTWDNYGEWHIDHKRPVSWFIADGVTDPAIVNALSNLQPLWAADNIRKLNRYEGN